MNKQILKKNNNIINLYLKTKNNSIITKNNIKNNFFNLLENKLFYDININKSNCNENDFIDVYVEPDGNCLFRCLALCFGLNIKGEIFREYLKKQYADSPLIFNDLKNILTSNSWGDLNVIIWIVCVFNICICIHFYSYKNKLIECTKYGNETYETYHFILKDNHYSFLNKKLNPILIDVNNNINENIFYDIKNKLEKYKNNNINVKIFKSVYEKNLSLDFILNEIYLTKENNNIILYEYKTKSYNKKLSETFIPKLRIYNNLMYYINIKNIQEINKFICNKHNNFTFLSIFSLKSNVFKQDYLNDNYNDHSNLSILESNNYLKLENKLEKIKIDFNLNILNILNKKNDSFFTENLIFKIYFNKENGEETDFNIIYIFNKSNINNIIYDLISNNLNLNKFYIQNFINNKDKELNFDIIYISDELIDLVNNKNINTIFKQENKLVERYSEYYEYIKNKKIKLDNDCDDIINFIENEDICFLEEKNNLDLTSFLDNEININNCFGDEDKNLDMLDFLNTEKNINNIFNEVEDTNFFFDDKKNDKISKKDTTKYFDGQLYRLKNNKYYIKVYNNFFK